MLCLVSQPYRGTFCLEIGVESGVPEPYKFLDPSNLPSFKRLAPLSADTMLWYLEGVLKHLR